MLITAHWCKRKNLVIAASTKAIPQRFPSIRKQTKKKNPTKLINVAGLIVFYETCQIFIAHTIHGTIVYFPT